jgi:type III secretion protein Q
MIALLPDEETPSIVAARSADIPVGPRLLSRSTRLIAISEEAAKLAELYGRRPVCLEVDRVNWRFRWCCVDALVAGVELRLRLGDADLAVGLADLGLFGAAGDVAVAELPPTLRAAYLNGLGASLWRELERMTGCAVEVMGVQVNCALPARPDCMGFEIGLDPGGMGTRGFLRSMGSDLQRILSEASRREMGHASVPASICIRWAAVVGNTTLPLAEARALEEQDIVVIDDARGATDSLSCWLGAGPSRRFAGRAILRRGGHLHMVKFTTKEQIIMTNIDAHAATDEAVFDDITVSLRFELVQWNASLAEVANLAPGSVIDLGERIDEKSVSVWVEQRCIGKGQLVAIGERLGVRLLSVFPGRVAAKAEQGT